MLIKIVQILFRLFLDFLCKLLEFFYPDVQGFLPPITNRLLLRPAVELVREIKDGKLKSATLVRAYAERVKQVQVCFLDSPLPPLLILILLTFHSPSPLLHAASD